MGWDERQPPPACREDASPASPLMAALSPGQKAKATPNRAMRGGCTDVISPNAGPEA
jgi:hypothetical protein